MKRFPDISDGADFPQNHNPPYCNTGVIAGDTDVKYTPTPNIEIENITDDGYFLKIGDEYLFIKNFEFRFFCEEFFWGQR